MLSCYCVSLLRKREMTHMKQMQRHRSFQDHSARSEHTGRLTDANNNLSIRIPVLSRLHPFELVAHCLLLAIIPSRDQLRAFSVSVCVSLCRLGLKLK